MANQQWLFKQANHGALYTNPDIQVEAQNKDFVPGSQMDFNPSFSYVCHRLPNSTTFPEFNTAVVYS